MAAGRAIAVVFFVMMVAMAGVKIGGAIPCFDDCMGHCLPVKHVSWEGCAGECDQACRSLGLRGRQPHHRRPPAAGEHRRH